MLKEGQTGYTVMESISIDSGTWSKNFGIGLTGSRTSSKIFALGPTGIGTETESMKLN